MEDAPPPSVQMMQMPEGCQISQALNRVANLGAAEQLLDGSRPAAEITDQISFVAESV